MTCNFIGNGIVCTSNNFRFVELETGEKFVFEHHSWSGAIIWKDEDMLEEIENWWDNDNISKYVVCYYDNKQHLKDNGVRLV